MRTKTPNKQEKAKIERFNYSIGPYTHFLIIISVNELKGASIETKTSNF